VRLTDREMLAAGKARDYETFKKMLDTALAAISTEYVHMPVAGRDGAIYRERVFCYEL
jgi:hypothetical protein